MGQQYRLCLTVIALTCTILMGSRNAFAGPTTEVQISVFNFGQPPPPASGLICSQTTLGASIATGSCFSTVGRSANGQASVSSIVGSNLFPGLATSGAATASDKIVSRATELAGLSETLMITGGSGAGSIVYQFTTTGQIDFAPVGTASSQLVVSQGGSTSTVLPCGPLIFSGLPNPCNTTLVTGSLPFTFGVPFTVQIGLTTSITAGILTGPFTATADASVMSQFQNAAVFDSLGQPVSNASIQILPDVPLSGPDLQILKSHTGDFTPGQIGAAYTIQVINFGTAASSGPVQVFENLPVGLTATAISGNGWDCNLASLSCLHSDPVGGNTRRFDPITVVVNVAPDAPALVINSATVLNSSDINLTNNMASDPTNIVTTGGRSR